MINKINDYEYDGAITIVIDSIKEYQGELSPYFFKFYLSGGYGYVSVSSTYNGEDDVFNMNLSNLNKIKNKCMEYVKDDEIEKITNQLYDSKQYLNNLGDTPSKELEQAVKHHNELKEKLNKLKDLKL